LILDVRLAVLKLLMVAALAACVIVASAARRVQVKVGEGGRRRLK